MLKAYLDRARRKEAGGIMSVAAAVFDPATYDFFLHEWQPILSAWNADAFHATDFYPGAGQFRRKRRDGNIDPALVEQYQRHSREIPAIIGRWVEKLFVLSFFEGEYQSIAPEPWRERFGGVHRVGAQLMLGGIGFWANKTNYQGEIEYFYETGDDEEAAMHDALCKLYRQPDQRAHTRMASTPIGVDKGKARL